MGEVLTEIEQVKFLYAAFGGVNLFNYLENFKLVSTTVQHMHNLVRSNCIQFIFNLSV